MHEAIMVLGWIKREIYNAEISSPLSCMTALQRKQQRCTWAESVKESNRDARGMKLFKESNRDTRRCSLNALYNAFIEQVFQLSTSKTTCGQ
jgi:hypothetical protein